jgi:biopolymer transport protein ExbB
MKSIKNMVIAAAFIGATVMGSVAIAQEPASSLSELLNRIRQDSREISAEAQRREQEFLQRRNEQQALLNQARGRVAALERESAQLVAQFEGNDNRIEELERNLLEAQGEFGEVFGAARQAAADVLSLIESSNVSAQHGDRTELLEIVASSSKLPSQAELDSIWKSMIGEMIYQREVTSFEARILNAGENSAAAVIPVTRIGSFTLFTNDGKTNFISQNGEGEFAVLSRKPNSRIVSAAESINRTSSQQITGGPIDPSRGALLGLMVDTPSLSERIDQGGAVGQVIIWMAIAGLIFGAYRFVILMLTALAVGGQSKSSKASKSNPLGRVMLAAEESGDRDLQTFELKIDQAIIKESGKLDAGLNLIKLLAAVAPLLGLLGTVTGMIIVFQQITLFGTGDPKIMAGGISQALVTTVLGLVAAIPLLLIHSFASSASRSVQQVLEEQAAGIVAEHAARRA